MHKNEWNLSWLILVKVNESIQMMEVSLKNWIGSKSVLKGSDSIFELIWDRHLNRIKSIFKSTQEK